jgi:hypothetical protein
MYPFQRGGTEDAAANPELGFCSNRNSSSSAGATERGRQIL